MPRRKAQWKAAEPWDYKLKPLRSQATGKHRKSIDPAMPDYPENKFVLFSNLNKSRQEDSKEDYWAKAQWPIDQIAALYDHAIQNGNKVKNQKGETCLEVYEELLPRTSQTGNAYYLAVISAPTSRS
jgi:hypothetical protein